MPGELRPSAVLVRVLCCDFSRSSLFPDWTRYCCSLSLLHVEELIALALSLCFTSPGNTYPDSEETRRVSEHSCVALRNHLSLLIGQGCNLISCCMSRNKLRLPCQSALLFQETHIQILPRCCSNTLTVWDSPFSKWIVLDFDFSASFVRQMSTKKPIHWNISEPKAFLVEPSPVSLYTGALTPHTPFMRRALNFVVRRRNCDLNWSFIADYGWLRYVSGSIWEKVVAFGSGPISH
jgi:hypothetical protein